MPLPVRAIGGGKFVPDTRGRGLADLLLIHTDPARMIFAELKGDGGVLSDAQKRFLRMARGVAEASMDIQGYRLIGVYSWRPGAEHMIEAILRSQVPVG